MKKALHNKQALLIRQVKGGFSRWDEDSIDVLIVLANDVHNYKMVDTKGYRGLKVGSILVPSPTYSERTSLVTMAFLDRYIDKGATNELLGELTDMLTEVPFQHVLVLDSRGHPKWKFIVDIGRQLDAEEFAAIFFSHLLSIGALENVKRCQMDECRRFFVGPPNRKWCSDSCGSKYRVRRKRKRDSV
jgi:hypothetical protein